MRDRPPPARRLLAGCALLAVGGVAAAGGALGATAAARPERAVPPPLGATATPTLERAVPPPAMPAPATPVPVPVPAPSPMPTPSLRTDLPCYLVNRSVQLAGAGFSGGAPYAVTVDRTQVGSGTVAPDGTLSGHLSSGRLVPGATHLKHTVSVSDAASHTATAEFQVTEFSGGFYPTRGNPATLVVRFSIYGFGLGRAAPLDPTPMPIYVHYVAPDGHSRRTIQLGRTHGRCGSLPRTRPRHLFPFTPTSGTWHLQLDLHPFYSPRSMPRVAQALVVR